MEGRNVTCRCRVVQGVVQTGDKLVVLPIGDETVVSRMEHHHHDGMNMEYADAADADASSASNNETTTTNTNRLLFGMAGDIVDLILTGIDVARITTGCILSHPHVSLRPPVTKKMQAKILVMEQLQVPIIRGTQVLFHMHSIDVPAIISKLLIATTNTKRGDGGSNFQKVNPRVITGGTSATVEITLQEKICLERFVDCRALGRFVLRRGGDSIAVGIIEAVL